MRSSALAVAAATNYVRMDHKMSHATLHMLCGKIASGKSTLTTDLRQMPLTIVISEDSYLKRLFESEINNVTDYIRCSRRLRDAISPLIQDLLRIGVSVVLDFPANTHATRSWMRTLFESTGADHCLHFLDVPDEVCKTRLRARNATKAHDFVTSDSEFDQITSYFVPPSETERFNVIRYETISSKDGLSQNS